MGKYFLEYGKIAANEELSNQGISLDEDLFENINPDGKKKSLEDFAGELFEQTQKHSVKVHSNFFVKLKIQNMGVAGSNELKKDFVNRFVTNCKTTSEQQKRDIANVIYGFKTSRGKQIPLSKQIQAINNEYSETKAKFIARNEVANLNEIISRTQAEESGFSCYEWLATHDMATRASHAAMDGMICRYDDSSVYSDDGGKTWKKRTSAMYHGHPGSDYNCRCCGAPFDADIFEDNKIENEVKEKYSKQNSIENYNEVQKKEEQKIIKEQNLAMVENFNAQRKLRSKFFSDEEITKSNVNKFIEKVFNAYPEYLGQNEKGKFSKPPSIIFSNKLPSGVFMMCTNKNEIHINLNSVEGCFNNKSISELYISSLNKIRLGKQLSFDEEYVLETFYHENLHNKTKYFGKNGTANEKCFEMITQFISRNEYDEFLRKIGGFSLNKEEILLRGYAYNESIFNFRNFLNAIGFSEDFVINEFKETLLNSKDWELFNMVNSFIERNSNDKIINAFKKENESLIISIMS